MMLTMNGTEGTFAPGSFGAMVEGMVCIDWRAGFAGGERLAKLAVDTEQAMGIDSADKAADVLRLAGMGAWSRDDGAVGIRQCGTLGDTIRVRWRRGEGWRLMVGECAEFEPVVSKTLSALLAARWYGLGKVEGLEVQRMLQRIAGTEVGP